MIVSPPIQLNNNSNEFIISRLRPFCFPIKAPITRKKAQLNLSNQFNWKNKYIQAQIQSVCMASLTTLNNTVVSNFTCVSH